MSPLPLACQNNSSVELPLAGIIPFSVSDWPGMITITAFTQGCPWRCRYCHNPSLQPFVQQKGTKDLPNQQQPATPSFDDLLQLAQKRRSLIDAVVLSGGEPTAHPALKTAVAQLKQRGFAIGLHTCGYSPKRLEALLRDENSRPDWIGLDVKALGEDLPQLVGCSLAAAKLAEKSLALVTHYARTTDMDIQLRTTTWPGSMVEKSLDVLRQRVQSCGGTLIIQQARDVDKQGYYLQPV